SFTPSAPSAVASLAAPACSPTLSAASLAFSLTALAAPAAAAPASSATCLAFSVGAGASSQYSSAHGSSVGWVRFQISTPAPATAAPTSTRPMVLPTLEPPLAFFSCAAAASLAASSSEPAFSAAVSAPSEPALAALSIASTTRGIPVSVRASWAASTAPRLGSAYSASLGDPFGPRARAVDGRLPLRPGPVLRGVDPGARPLTTLIGELTRDLAGLLGLLAELLGVDLVLTRHLTPLAHGPRGPAGNGDG